MRSCVVFGAIFLRCVVGELWLTSKDFEVVERVIQKCAQGSSRYSCLANRAALAMERASKSDVPLFDGLILRKNNETFPAARGFSGIPRLKHAVSRFLDSHILTLDLTDDRVGKQGGVGGPGGATPPGGNARPPRFKISRRERGHFWYTMMVLLGIFGLTGPLVMKALTLMAGKALIASKIALLMVGSVALKKIFAHDNHGSDVKVHTHTIPFYDDHDRIYNPES